MIKEGEKLRKARSLRKMTRRQVALKTGINEGHLRNIEMCLVECSQYEKEILHKLYLNE